MLRGNHHGLILLLLPFLLFFLLLSSFLFSFFFYFLSLCWPATKGREINEKERRERDESNGLYENRGWGFYKINQNKVLYWVYTQYPIVDPNPLRTNRNTQLSTKGLICRQAESLRSLRKLLSTTTVDRYFKNKESAVDISI